MSASDDDWDDDWDEEAWEEEAADDEAADAWAPDGEGSAGGGSDPRRLQRGLALGVLAAAPLVIAYEWSVWSVGGAERNTAERLVSLPLLALGAPADPVRQLAVLASLLVALVWLRRHDDSGAPLAPRVLRVPLEGLLAALLLGPALVALQELVGAPAVPLGFPDAAGRASPSLATGAAVAGGAFWEELVFRVGLLSLFWIAWRVLADFLGASRPLARVFAELGGVATAAAVFAAFHLDAVSELVGIGGERFDGAVFTWRFVGGCLLGLVYRWRGFGVAAWCHGLFNLALLLGAGPDVLR